MLSSIVFTGDQTPGVYHSFKLCRVSFRLGDVKRLRSPAADEYSDNKRQNHTSFNN